MKIADSRLRTQDLSRGPIMRGVLLFALPMIAGDLLQQCYNLVDTLVVGRLLGDTALAAVGSSFSLITLVTSILLGLCLGSGALFSIQFGAGTTTRLLDSVYAAFVLIGLVAAALTGVCFLLLDALGNWLRVPKEAWPLMRSYLEIVFCGIPAVFLYNFYACLLRALGNSKTPLMFLAIAAAVNIILDLWFVAGLGFGVRSVALATTVAQWVGGIGIAIFTAQNAPEYRLHRIATRLSAGSVKQVASYSLLTCLQQSIMNLGILMVQGLVNSFGITVMAAFAAAVKIDAFAYLPVQDFGNAFSTFVAQNHGAGSRERIQRGFTGAVGVSVLFSLAVSFTVCLAAPMLMAFFVDPGNRSVIGAGTTYLRIEGPYYFAIGVLFLLYGLFRALGHPGFSVVLTVCSLGTRVVLAHLLSGIPEIGVAGIWWSVPIGWFFADAVGLFYFGCRRKQLLPQSESR